MYSAYVSRLFLNKGYSADVKIQHTPLSRMP